MLHAVYRMLNMVYFSPMKIPIEKVAELANILLSDSEKKNLSVELEKILAHVEKINSIAGLEQVEPTSHPFASENVYREDVVHTNQAAQEVLKYAPEREGNFFKVPKVIEQ